MRPDRPEFLFGVDMNNNGIIDRFENDILPDYLYKRDRRGYNVYVGSHLGPEARLTVGRLNERQLADSRENATNYALLTFDKDYASKGRVQVYNNYRRVQDDIRDHVIEWVVREGSTGDLVPYTDPLPLRDGWANTLVSRLSVPERPHPLQEPLLSGRFSNSPISTSGQLRSRTSARRLPSLGSSTRSIIRSTSGSSSSSRAGRASFSASGPRAARIRRCG